MFQEIKTFTEQGLRLLNDQFRGLWRMKTGGNGMFEEIKALLTPMEIKKLNDQLRALWKTTIGAPVPVLIYNGKGVNVDEWLVIVFDKKIDTRNIEANIGAFTVTGAVLQNPVTYRVYKAEALNDRRVAIRVDSFMDDDGDVLVKYSADKGNLKGESGLVVASFEEHCYPTGLNPNIRVFEKFKIQLSVGVHRLTSLFLKPTTDSATVKAWPPTPIPITETYNPILLDLPPQTLPINTRSMVDELSTALIKFGQVYLMIMDYRHFYVLPMEYVTLEQDDLRFITRHETYSGLPTTLGTGAYFRLPLPDKSLFQTIGGLRVKKS